MIMVIIKFLQLTVCGVHGLSAVEVVVLELKAEWKILLNDIMARIAQDHLSRTVTQISHHVRQLKFGQSLAYIYMSVTFIRHAFFGQLLRLCGQRNANECELSGITVC